MVVDANLLNSGPRYRVRTPEERERAFVSAGRHSRMVRILRKSLPVFGLLVLAAYFVSTRLNITVGDVTASIDGMDIVDGNLRMLNPTLEGTDKKNGKYVVRADHADQDIKNPEDHQAARDQGQSFDAPPAAGRACRPCAACSTARMSGW